MNLFLDVDGVVCPTAQRMDSDVDDFVGMQGRASVIWSPRIVEALNALDVTICWLTTWEKEANVYLAPAFGWDTKTVLARGEETLWWKLDALLAYQDPAEPFVWIDDEISWRLGDSEDEYGLLLSGLHAPRMLVSPWPGQGLTLAQIADIAEFVSHATSSSVTPNSAT